MNYRVLIFLLGTTLFVSAQLGSSPVLEGGTEEAIGPLAEKKISVGAQKLPPGVAVTGDSGETRIQVTGMDPDHAKRAFEKMEGRLFYVRRREAAPSRADDAAFLLKRHLVLEGYREVEVDWSLPGNGTILLNVSRGPRYTIGRLEIKNAFVGTPEEHPDYFLQPFNDRSKLQQDEYAFLKEDFEKGKENLRNYLRSEGYWKAEVESAEPSFDRDRQKVDLVLMEKPGTLFKLARPSLEINGAPVAPKLLTDMDPLIGLPATTANINKIRNLVEKTYTDDGFPYLELKMTQVDEDGLTRLSFVVTTGERYRVGEVKVIGNKRTETSRIQRRFRDLQGEEFDRDEADDRVRQLLGTGAFENIRLRDRPQSDGTVDFLVQVEEAKSYGVKFYGGAGSLEGPILGTGYFDRNLWGGLYNFEVGLEYSGLGLLGEVSLTDPFFLERDIAWKNRAFILTRDFDGYQKGQVGIESSLRADVNDYYEVELAYSLAYIDLKEQDGLPASALGNTNYLLNKVRLLQKYDRRNNIALPTKGYFIEMDTNFGFAAGNNSISFLSNELGGTWYAELGEKNRFALGARLGAIKPLGDAGRLPIDLRYFNGGSNSVRSFRERELGPEINDVPRGGRSYFIANFEYFRKLVGPVYAVAFLDAGGLSADLDFGLSDPRYAAGGGIQLDLPIGPVRFEYGHALNPGKGEKSGVFHFAIGAAF